MHARSLAALSKLGTKTGGVGERLTQFANDERMDAIVIGSRGLGSLKRWDGRGAAWLGGT
jgi:nucleotide-binding universal stress UspA family protein